MQVGDLVEYTSKAFFPEDPPEKFVGLVVKLGLSSGKQTVKILWCFSDEDKEYYDETSWLHDHEVKLIRKRTENDQDKPEE
jgi:hypothetical protein